MYFSVQSEIYPQRNYNELWGDSVSSASELSCKHTIEGVLLTQNNKTGVDNGGSSWLRAASCADSFRWVQIRAQFIPGNARRALNLQHAQRRNLIPLRNRLCGHTNCFRQSSLSAGALNCSFQR